MATTAPATTKPTYLKPDPAGIPAEMKLRKQWILWQAVWDPKQNKYTKVPYQVNGRIKASSTDPRTWATFNDAMRAYEMKRGDGIGYVFTADDPFVGIDLDHCLADEELPTPYTGIVEAFDTYTERSVSGDGLHIICRVEDKAILDGQRRKNGPYECYGSARFFAFTGHVWGRRTEIAGGKDREVLAFIKDYLEPKPDPKPKRIPDEHCSGSNGRLDDDGVIRKLQREGGKADDLWLGNWQSHYPDKSQSEGDSGLCRKIAFYVPGNGAEDAAQIARIFQRSALYREDKFQRDIVARCIPDALAKVTKRWSGFTKGAKRTQTPPAGDEQQAVTAAPSKPEIEVVAGTRPQQVDAAIAALQAAEVPIYNRGGMLVRPVRLETKDSRDGVTREAGALTLRDLDTSWLGLTLGRVVDWKRYDARTSEWVPTDAAPKVVETICNVADHGGWPVLRAVTQCPVLFPDGRRVTAPGYDAQSGLYLDLTEQWPALPARLTQEDAVRARELVEKHIEHFIFAGETQEQLSLSGKVEYQSVHRAVAVAMLLTAVVRPSMDVVPAFAVDAPVRGSGKSLLIDAAAILATGTRASCLEHSHNPEEVTKRLDGMLLAGDSIITIDNIEAPIEGAALCSTITQTSRRIRILGLSKMVTVPCTTLIFLNGNNIVLKGDITRRVLTCRIDPRTERPEKRKIPQDLIAETLERRRELVGALHTIAAAYIQADKPEQDLDEFGGFKEWNRLVRHALVWSGAADPLKVQEAAHEDNPEREALHTVLTTWREYFGANPTTATDAVRRAKECPDLRDALALVCMRRGDLDARALGYWLRQNRDAQAGGLAFKQAEKGMYGARWYAKGA